MKIRVSDDLITCKICALRELPQFLVEHFPQDRDFEEGLVIGETESWRWSPSDTACRRHRVDCAARCPTVIFTADCPLPAVFAANDRLKQFRADHPEPAYADRIALEHAALSRSQYSIAFVSSMALVAAARDRGALVIPAQRTAESLWMYACGASGVDPIAAKMDMTWPERKRSTPCLQWFAGAAEPRVATTAVWQIAAAEALWPGGYPFEAEAIDADGCAQVMAQWAELVPGVAPPVVVPTDRWQLAAEMVLTLDGGIGTERPPRRAAYHGWSDRWRPSPDAQFADSGGWPLFLDDIARWLTAQDGVDPASVPARVRQLRVLRTMDPASQQRALAFLDLTEPIVPLLMGFAPVASPRSVALVEAQLAVIGARCLARDRGRTVAVRERFLAEYAREAD